MQAPKSSYMIAIVVEINSLGKVKTVDENDLLGSWACLVMVSSTSDPTRNFHDQLVATLYDA